MESFNKIPGRDRIVEFLREKGLANDKITHSIKVTDLALRIAQEIEKKGIKLDKNVVEAGGLLHDIGLTELGVGDYETEAAKPVPEHCAIGAKIARNAGFPESVAHCIESHEFWIGEEARICKFPDPIKESYVPKTWEAKTVAYADIVIFSAVEEGHDLWKDAQAIVETYYPYFQKCFYNATGEKITKKHPIIQRINSFNKEMIEYLKPEFIPEPWREFKKQTL